MLQLIYVSLRTPSLTQAVLHDVVRHSSVNNQARDISGVLMCCGQHVMQLLEGEPQRVESLFQKISIDPRHDRVQCLLRKTVSKRLFPEWGMGLADLECKADIRRDRLVSLIADVQSRTQTANYSVEARILLNDFSLQFRNAA